MLLGLGTSGKYTENEGTSAESNIFIGSELGLGLALCPYFHFGAKGSIARIGFAPYVGLGYIPTENLSGLSAIYSVLAGVKLDLFITEAFGFNAGFELGGALATTHGYYTNGKEFKGEISALQIGFYGGVSASF